MSNQLTRIQFPMDRDGHGFHALLIEPFFNKILNVKHG